MSTEFVLQTKCTIFWIKRVLREYLGLCAPDCHKSISKYLIFTKVVKKHGYRCFTAMCHFRMQCFFKEFFWAAQSFKLFQTHMLSVLLSSSEKFFKKTLHPKMTHCCEAPRSMLSYYFSIKKVLKGAFGEIWLIQIQMYHQTSIEPKYGAFNLKNKVSAHGIGWLVQLS